MSICQYFKCKKSCSPDRIYCSEHYEIAQLETQMLTLNIIERYHYPLKFLSSIEIKELIGEQAVSYLQEWSHTLINVNLDYYTEMKCPLKLPDKIVEYRFNKAVKGSLVAEGHSELDVIFRDIGVDVKGVSLGTGKRTSGETSLIQNFGSSGVTLDLEFKEKKYDDLVYNWTSLWRDKLEEEKSNTQLITCIMYFLFSYLEKLG